MYDSVSVLKVRLSLLVIVAVGEYEYWELKSSSPVRGNDRERLEVCVSRDGYERPVEYDFSENVLEGESGRPFFEPNGRQKGGGGGGGGGAIDIDFVDGRRLV